MELSKSKSSKGKSNMKDQPVKYQKEFKTEIDQMTDKLLKLENQRNFIYDPEDESMGKRLFLVRKVNNMVEC